MKNKMKLRVYNILNFQDENKDLVNNNNAEELRIEISDNHNNKWAIGLKDSNIEIMAIGNNGNIEIHPRAANYIIIN